MPRAVAGLASGGARRGGGYGPPRHHPVVADLRERADEFRRAQRFTEAAVAEQLAAVIEGKF